MKIFILILLLLMPFTAQAGFLTTVIAIEAASDANQAKSAIQKLKEQVCKPKFVKITSIKGHCKLLDTPVEMYVDRCTIKALTTDPRMGLCFVEELRSYLKLDLPLTIILFKNSRIVAVVPEDIDQVHQGIWGEEK